MMKTQDLILELIREERIFQEDKYGKQAHTFGEWLGILVSQCGSVASAVTYLLCQDINERGKRNYLKKNLIQVAAVAVAWLESLEED